MISIYVSAVCCFLGFETVNTVDIIEDRIYCVNCGKLHCAYVVVYINVSVFMSQIGLRDILLRFWSLCPCGKTDSKD